MSAQWEARTSVGCGECGWSSHAVRVPFSGPRARRWGYRWANAVNAAELELHWLRHRRFVSPNFGKRGWWAYALFVVGLTWIAVWADTHHRIWVGWIGWVFLIPAIEQLRIDAIEQAGRRRRGSSKD